MNAPTDPAEIKSEHLNGARLFANREDMIKAFARPTEIVGEIGVALGDFSKKLIEVFNPGYFVAFDMFNMHEQEGLIWGKTSSELLKGKTHPQYYRDEMDGLIERLLIEAGRSQDNLKKYGDKSFDVLYIDGDHNYEPVKEDAGIALQKIKDDGLIIFNDYVMYDHFGGYPYGVVQVVNEIVASTDWKIVGFALQRWMFCDIALQRV